MTLAEFVKQKREDLNLSQNKLALKAGISQSSVHRIESGAHKKPDMNTLIAISNALKLSPEDKCVLSYLAEYEVPYTEIENINIRIKEIEENSELKDKKIIGFQPGIYSESTYISSIEDNEKKMARYEKILDKLLETLAEPIVQSAYRLHTMDEPDERLDRIEKRLDGIEEKINKILKNLDKK